MAKKKTAKKKAPSAKPAKKKSGSRRGTARRAPTTRRAPTSDTLKAKPVKKQPAQEPETEPVEPAPAKKKPATRRSAQELATKQREISVAEFFTKNRHLLGFDNPKKALLTTIKEAVDNALDACEEAGIVPDLYVEITPIGSDRYKVIVEDNGPGIVKAQIPKIFGKLLYGSKFHRLKQSRGQQGIGISAAAMYGQLTTGSSCRITSRTGKKKPAHYFEIHIDTQKNNPEVSRDEIVEWEKNHGTRVEIDLEASFQRGRRSVEEYLDQTLVANPHVSMTYKAPDAQELAHNERTAKELPIEAAEIQPHPHGVELGRLMQMLKVTKSKHLKGFLTSEFSRVSPAVAEDICAKTKLTGKSWTTSISRDDADALHKAIQKTKIMRPPTNCLAPIGEEQMLAGLMRVVPDAEFTTSVSRSPTVYRGNPFLVEMAISWGGEGRPADAPAELIRFANRVPLQYQQSACAITKGVVGTSWKQYGLSQPRGALPIGPMVIAVHMASVWVPFTSESKEAIASYPEILKELRLGLQECGRRLGQHIRKKARVADAEKKKAYIKTYIPQVALALQDILKLSDRETTKTTNNLTEVLEKSRKIG